MRWARSLSGLIIGYFAGAGSGAALVQFLSTNTHDKSVEMAMTAAFVTGPAGAVLGLVAALLTGGARRAG